MPRCLMRGNSETVIKDCPVADPGFPRGGGTNPKGGVPTYYLANFSPKLHENEEILDQRGHASLASPLDPPLLPVYSYHILEYFCQ